MPNKPIKCEKFLEKLIGNAEVSSEELTKLKVQINKFVPLMRTYLELSSASGKQLQKLKTSEGLEEASIEHTKLRQEIKMFQRDLRIGQGPMAGHEVKAAIAFREQQVQEIERIIRILESSRNYQKREPIATGILNYLKEFQAGTVAPGGRKQALNQLLSHIKWGFFSLTSFTFDVLGNVGALGSQAGGKVGKDIGHVFSGNLYFPHTRGMIDALRQTVTRDPVIWLNDVWDNKMTVAIKNKIKKDYPELHEEILNKIFRRGEGAGAISGEKVFLAGGTVPWGTDQPGIFTTRTDRKSKEYDFWVGLPLYSKLIVDNFSKRTAALASILGDANSEADKRGLWGKSKRDFIESFSRNPEQKHIDKAVNYARDAGFDVDLPKWMEDFSRSSITQIVVSLFPRWGFQFGRWTSSALGVNYGDYKRLGEKFKKGELNIEDFTEFAVKAATGWGGLILVNSWYDDVDFERMEYVTEEGNRYRLAGRDPLPTALGILALIKGDWDKATAAMKHTSLPFVQYFADEDNQGLIGGITQSIYRWTRNPTQRSVERLEDELTKMFAKFIPGNAVLTSMASVFDPVIREQSDLVGTGLFSKLPGLSRTRPAVINPATGKPLERKIKLPFVNWELPSIQGFSLPGMEIQVDPAYKILSQIGADIYRGPRKGLLGFAEAEVPKEIRREWMISFAKYRHMYATYLSITRLDDILSENKLKDIVREFDRMSAMKATDEIYSTRNISRSDRKIFEDLSKLQKSPRIELKRGPTDWLKEWDKDRDSLQKMHDLMLKKIKNQEANGTIGNGN